MSKLALLAKVAGLCICAAAVPMAYHEGVASHVRVHKPLQRHSTHPQAHQALASTFTCPRYRSQHPVTFAKWDIQDTPISYTPEQTVSASPVDEPYSWVLFGTGLVVLAAVSFRGISSVRDMGHRFRLEDEE